MIPEGKFPEPDSSSERPGRVDPAGGGARGSSMTTGLEAYDDVKFALAGLIREADAAAWRAKRQHLQQDLQALMGRLAGDRFYLTLAGQFSRGKTTLMNAMLGMDRLPTGILPMTSVITAVSYGTAERVVLHFQGSNLTHEAAIIELPEWITENGNPGNERKIEMAEVQLPAELLRRGAFFVDTPGLGSAILENTETTNRFLPHIDALVLVTSFEFPLSQEEIGFLKRTGKLGRKIFVVVNKVDLVSSGERADIFAFIRRRIAEETGSNQIPLFAVSSAEALRAKLEGDPVRLERSGLAGFEQALVDYLLTDRSNDFLAATCDRLEALLASEGVPGLSELRSSLEDVRSKIGGAKRPSADSPPVLEGGGFDGKTGKGVKIRSCAICKLMADETFHFLSQYQYNIMHHREIQLAHAASAGFCTLHSREYARIASPQGIAAAYPNTLIHAARCLRGLVRDGRLMEDWNHTFDDMIPEYHKCPACLAISETENQAIEDFIREVQSKGSASENEPPSTCLRHLRLILHRLPDADLAVALVLHSAMVLARTAENMERYALRHAGRHMELTSSEERESPEKALNLLVGQPNVRPGGGS